MTSLPSRYHPFTVETQSGCSHPKVTANWVQYCPPSTQRRSYVVKAAGKEYRRNRKHLLRVFEPPPAESTREIPFQSKMDLHTPTPATTEVPTTTATDQVPVNNYSRNNSEVVTRSGRVSKPNSRYQDYVTQLVSLLMDSVCFRIFYFYFLGESTYANWFGACLHVLCCLTHCFRIMVDSIVGLICFH